MRGYTDKKIEVDNLHIVVNWNGAPLYTEDHDEKRVYKDDVSVDLTWYLPSYTPAGSFVCTITGTDKNGKTNLCTNASFYLL